MQALAEKMNRSRTAISHWRAGNVSASIEMVEAFAEALGCTVVIIKKPVPAKS